MKYPATHHNADLAWPAAFAVLAAVIRGRYAATYTNRTAKLLAWRGTQNQPCAVAFYAYSPAAFRLSTHGICNDSDRIPCRLYLDRRNLSPYSAQLSFSPKEIQTVADGFTHFVEDLFLFPDQPELIWRWPLFARVGQRSYPYYAWSAAGKEAQQRREAAQKNL